ncbi:Cdc7p-Dbf4p kinase complex regulatory subunit [Malassezia sp. CBS 17886]|nr:Cdc7p-Dbf4p kinase complex regulatory subunit [Malassezia sp. CBS 17886]
MSRAPQHPWTRLPLRVKNAGGTDTGVRLPDSSGGVGKRELARSPDMLGTPPRKRAVPLDDVHARNIPENGSARKSKVLRAERTRDEAARSPQCARSTTLRIDRASRMSREERYQREHQKAHSQRQWKAAFGRAFPRFVFYLDSIDDTPKRTLSAQIAQLGARSQQHVEDFFSRSVTHVVTTRPIPLVSARDKENAADAVGGGAADAASARMRAAPLPGGLTPPRIVTPAARDCAPLHSDRNPLDEWTQTLPTNDVLSRAQQFGMKIWRQEKLQNIVSLLLAEDAAGADGAPRQDLSQMLLQEKLHGTTERDPYAARSDFHYFGKNTYHLLVLDATGEHRPIATCEYDRHAHEHQGKPPPWPVLHGDVEGRGLFVRVDAKDRERLARQAPAPHEGHASLRRAASLNLATAQRPGWRHESASGTPNLMASDNSIALASTVASTTSTMTTSQAGLSAAALPDKRVAELNRRTHTALPDARTVRAADGEESHGGGGAVVRRMLGLDGTRGDAPALRRTRSAGGTLARSALSLRAREKRPGHCENCRCRFEDYDEHVRTRRHRKFALDETNFVSLDDLLQRVQRVPIEEADSGAWSDYDASHADMAPGGDAEEAFGSDDSVAQMPLHGLGTGAGDGGRASL